MPLKKFVDWKPQLVAREEVSWQEQRDQSVRERKQLKPMTPNQAIYLEAIKKSTITICVGPAGTGKTWLACGLAAQMLQEGKVERIVLTRPLHECDEEVGTEPGMMMDKVAMMIQPMMDAFGDFLSKKEIKEYIESGILMVVPLAKMRGRTFHNAFIILDESQNSSARQMRMFLTRFGKNAKVVVNGDHTQSDLRPGVKNGIADAVSRLEPLRSPAIAIVRLYRQDIVRHPLIQLIDESYDSEQEEIQLGVWHNFKCPGCKKTNWVNNGAEDGTSDDAEICACWRCGNNFSLPWEDDVATGIFVHGHPRPQ